MNTFWSQEAGLVQDPTLVGVNPNNFMEEILCHCLDEEILWNFRHVPKFLKKVQDYLDDKYKMFSPKVIGVLESCINYTSLCSNTYVGKFKHSADINVLCSKYGLFIIQLKEVEIIYDYVWIPYTQSIEGRGSYLSTYHDQIIWENLINECIAQLKGNKLIKYNDICRVLVKQLEQIILKNIGYTF